MMESHELFHEGYLYNLAIGLISSCRPNQTENIRKTMFPTLLCCLVHGVMWEEKRHKVLSFHSSSPHANWKGREK